jgi:choline dehydrogenase-like flavoprotein
MLERGQYVPREKDNWVSRVVNLEGKYAAREVWKDADGKDLHPHTNYVVGGNTKFYGAALFRLRKEDFGEIQHHGGISPAWPITYDELEPYYNEAERMYHVHGTRGEDPTEPPASAPYPHPAVSHEPRIAQLAEDFAAQGLRPFHVPLGVMLDEKNRTRSKCIRCNTCDGFPCLLDAKSDAQVCGVDAALMYPNVTLLTGAKVERLKTDSSGRTVRSVEVTRGTQTEDFTADVVIVSCGALHGAHQLGPDGAKQVPEPDRVSKDLGRERLLLRRRGVPISDGPHQLRRQARWRHPEGRGTRDRAGLDPGPHGPTLARLLADQRRPARS